MLSRIVEPNKDYIEYLVNLGVPREQTFNALSNTQNNLESARRLCLCTAIPTTRTQGYPNSTIKQIYDVYLDLYEAYTKGLKLKFQATESFSDTSALIYVASLGYCRPKFLKQFINNNLLIIFLFNFKFLDGVGKICILPLLLIEFILQCVLFLFELIKL